MKDDVLELAEILQLRRKARSNFADFCRYMEPEEPPSFHHRFLCSKLDQVIEGKIRRLMVFMPPGCAKSTYTTKRFPPYYVGRFSKKNIITTSADAELVTEFGRIVRNYVDNPKFKLLFPGIDLCQDSRAKDEWAVTSGGTYKSKSVGATIIGRRGDIGIIDDPTPSQQAADSKLERNNLWRWYKSDFFSRLKPNAIQIIIQTRWNEDDLSGRILGSAWDGKSGVYKGFDGQDWHVVCFPAQAKEDDVLGRKPGEWLWPEYYTPEVWEEIKSVQTDKNRTFRVWESLYQQNPQPDDGIHFKREWFESGRYDLGKHPPITPYGASDYAVTRSGGDFTEMGVGGYDSNYDLWFTDWWSDQEAPDTWIDIQISMARRHKVYHWISEVGVIRRAIESQLDSKKKERLRAGSGQFFTMHWLPHIGDKAAKAWAFKSMAMAGKVHIPKCKWGDELIDQLVRFIPNANIRDDKVDVCGFFGRILDEVFAPVTVSYEEKKPKDEYGFDDEPEISWKIM